MCCRSGCTHHYHTHDSLRVGFRRPVHFVDRGLGMGQHKTIGAPLTIQVNGVLCCCVIDLFLFINVLSQILNGAYSMPRYWFPTIDNPKMVQIKGNSASPSSVTITCSNCAQNTWFLVFDQGCAGVSISGLTLRASKATALVSNSGLVFGADLVVQNSGTAFGVYTSGQMFLWRSTASACNGLFFLENRAFAAVVGVSLVGIGAADPGAFAVTLLTGSVINSANAPLQLSLSNVANGVFCDAASWCATTDAISFSSVGNPFGSCANHIP